MRRTMRDATMLALGALAATTIALSQPTSAARHPRYDGYQKHVMLVVASRYNTKRGRAENIKWMQSLTPDQYKAVIDADDAIVKACEAVGTPASGQYACGE